MPERFPSLSDALDREAIKLNGHSAARKLLRQISGVALKAEAGDQYALFHLARMIRELCKDRYGAVCDDGDTPPPS